MTGTVVVKITVTDINDNPPFFTQHNYTAVVQVGTRIYVKVWKIKLSKHFP